MTRLGNGRSIGAELLAAGTNLLASSAVFCGVWLSFKRLRFGPLLNETVLDLTLTVLLYLPLTFLVVYFGWRFASLTFRTGERSRMPSVWLPGTILGAVLGLLDAYAGVLEVWTPLFRRLTG